MLIRCQSGDILHMIGLHRLIKTWAQGTDSFLQPLRGFPSTCSSGKSKKSVSQIWFVVEACLSLPAMSVKSKLAECHHDDGLISRWKERTRHD